MNLCLLMIAAAGLAGSVRAAEFYVSPNGNDASDGSLDHPFKTIGRAVGNAEPGTSIIVRGGIYSERVVIKQSGTEGRPITLRGQTGEEAILDGSQLQPGEYEAPLLQVADGVSFVRVEGLTLRNFKTDRRISMPMAVYVNAAKRGCRSLEFVKLKIHGIWQSFDDGQPHKGSAADAHGLAVYGRGLTEETAVDGLLIEDCEVFDLKLGSSEALVVNGNVKHFKIRRCRVHDCNNIGIVMIGFEKTCKNEALDQARLGEVTDCEVYNIDTTGNVAYRSAGKEGAPKFDLSADGIYVDGGRDVVIERNRVHHCNIGIEAGCEHKGKTTSGVVVRNNYIHHNTGFTGLSVGGYDARRGLVVKCVFQNNTLYANETPQGGNGQLHLQWYVQDCVFENNLIVAQPGSGMMIGGPTGKKPTFSKDNQFRHNVYVLAGSNQTPAWTYEGREIAGADRSNPLTAWKAALGGAGQEEDSLMLWSLEDVGFANAEQGHFRLRENSKATGAGASF
jgi:hypothetical protein